MAVGRGSFGVVEHGLIIASIELVVIAKIIKSRPHSTARVFLDIS